MLPGMPLSRDRGMDRGRDRGRLRPSFWLGYVDTLNVWGD